MWPTATSIYIPHRGTPNRCITDRRLKIIGSLSRWQTATTRRRAAEPLHRGRRRRRRVAGREGRAGDVADVDVGDLQLDGQDISGILGGVQKTLPSRELFWHTGSHAELKRGTWTALRQGDWKFLETSKGEQHLFNLEQDLHEKADLKAQHPKLFNDLKNRRDALLKECLPK